MKEEKQLYLNCINYCYSHWPISCATVQLSTFYELVLLIIVLYPRIQAEIREAEKENVARQKQVSFKSFRDSVHLNAVSHSTFLQLHSFPRHMRSWIRGYMSMTSVWHQNQRSLYRWASQIWIWILSRPMYIPLVAYSTDLHAHVLWVWLKN